MEHIDHLKGYHVYVSGLSVNLAELIGTVRFVIDNIESPDSNLLSHEEISERLTEVLSHAE